MNHPHALILGEALIDIVSRPDHSTAEIPGGSPANVALTLARLGRSARLVTHLGNDERGRAITAHLQESGVSIDPASYHDCPTSTAQALIGEDGAATYHFDLTWELPAVTVDSHTLVAHSGSIAATLEPGGSQVVDALRRAREHATVTYDPNARPTIMGEPREVRERIEQIAALSDVIKVSDEDLQWLSEGQETPEATAQRWVQAGTAVVVITRGPRGASAFTAAARLDVPAADAHVVDTVGAGDSFMGGLIDALWSEGLLGAEARERLAAIDEAALGRVVAHASAVSGVTVSRAGANPPWKEELGGR